MNEFRSQSPVFGGLRDVEFGPGVAGEFGENTNCVLVFPSRKLSPRARVDRRFDLGICVADSVARSDSVCAQPSRRGVPRP
jgi:hypothetical protein